MIDDLDFYFPFIIFFYGSVMMLVTNLPVFRKLAREKMNPQMVERFFAHQFLGFICCSVGGLWLIQRLIIS